MNIRQLRQKQLASAIIGAVISLVILGVAALFGATASLGSPLLLLPLLMLAGAIALIALPTGLVVWFLLAAAFVFTGPLIYFRVADTPARWLTVLIGSALVLPLLGRLAAGKFGTKSGHQPVFVFWLWAFIASATFATVIDQPTGGDMFNAFRSYIAYLPLFFLLMLGIWSPDQYDRAFKAMLVVGLIQLPVAFYQHFWVAPKSSHSAQLDAVVGTFPGNAEGGGANAAMGVFVVMCLMFGLSLWRRGLLKTWHALAIGVATVGTIGLAEVKAVVLMIPLAIGLLFVRELSRRPVTVLVATVLGASLSLGLLYIYSQAHYDDAQKSELSASQRPESPIEAIQNQLNPEKVSRYTSTPSRAAALKDWYVRNVERGDLQHVLFGHGVGSTQASRFGIGELTKTIFYSLDQTSTAMLLWEVGVVGHLLFFLMLLSAAWTAWRLASAQAIPVVHQAYLHASGVCLLVFAITLPYKSFVLKTSPSQILLMLMLGYVAYWARQVHEARVAHLAAAHRVGAPRRAPAVAPGLTRTGTIHQR